MRSYLSIAVLFCLLLSCGKKEPSRVLVFSKTKGYRHESIDTGKVVLMQLGRTNGFEVDTTEDASVFNDETLKRYQAVIFLSTTMDVLDVPQQDDFKRYIEAGGGFVGIHAAADTEYEWPWYGRLVGAWFKSHPKTQQATVRKVKAFGEDHVPDAWTRTDEWYNYKKISPDIQVTLSLDESSYEGGENGTNHPIAWYHEFEGGRSFYTGMGHTKESYADSLYLGHLLQGIRYAIGDGVKLDYAKAKTKRAPEENRFTKTVLDFNLDEPTEMAILPDGRVMFLERKGAVKLYDPADGKVKVINTFTPGTKFEDGMIGLALDPKFSENHFVYVFYAHPERSANVVSRFLFADNKIDQTSEKEIIEVVTQRETCCHTAGSMAFGSDGNLYISTGDNTSPFASDGFSPSDEIPGRSPFDAQKSSGNTNDLRGKILRIHVEADGTYTIPEGNLFAKGEEKTRPEIYVMGCRNPYRISIDEKTGYVYWGEVGPDAGQNDSLRGPRGYDEINQAKKAGNFGWPYFVGNNYAYAKYDFVNKKVLQKWDVSAPINESPNNTGKRELPPANPAFVWYPYAKSEDFPMVKEGGRNAMAGPIYYSEHYKNVATAFPDYFDGKLLMYDWIRNWMFLVTMTSDGAIDDIEPFMPNTKFNNISDMAYGPDGRLYMIEYGTVWFKQNIDARLVRIDFNGGNRPPVVAFAADKTSGAVPLQVAFTAKGSVDPDGNKLTYELDVDGKKLKSDNGEFDVTFDKPGVVNATLRVTDDNGMAGSSTIQVTAGNQPPVVKAAITSGNKTFYFPNTALKYEVTVADQEDGSTTDGKIAGGGVIVTFDYLKGYDMTHIAQGHQQAVAELPGKALIAQSDCKACHIIDQKSAGPAYKDVATKYKGQKDAVDVLAAKVIKGGAGVWGTIEMAAHPQISVDDARKMVEYVLSLAADKNQPKLPLSGSVMPGKETDGAYVLTATYYDKAQGAIPSLSASDAVVLRSNVLSANAVSDLQVARKVNYQGQWGLENLLDGSFAVYRNLDMSGIKKATVTTYIVNKSTNTGGDVEIRLDKPDGKLIGKMTSSKVGIASVSTNLSSETGTHDLYLVFRSADAKEKSMFYFSSLRLDNK
ncbi:MAG TPA: ThuA domain-containing protein [Chryseolinea sp.]|nr:ThuA domain-containing protein [Chryseolinea sp.]